MATIALYANQMNQMPGLIGNIKKNIVDFQSELSVLKTNSLQINQSICDLSGVISSIQASSQTQEQKADTLEMISQNIEQFTEDAARIDDEVADAVRQRKEDFYKKYNYLKPANEKNWLEIKLEKASDWCKEHWKEIVITVAIVIGAVFAIGAVICSGGMALVPILVAGLTAFGVPAGTAITAAVMISLTVSSIAIISTLVSTTLNIVDIWCDMSNNSVFKFWKNAMNWISAISNGFYSVGAFYNAAHGITNESLFKLAKILKGENNYLSQIVTSPNNSAFWSGLGSGGDKMAADLAKKYGKETLEMTIDKLGVVLPEYDWKNKIIVGIWEDASSAFAWNSSGNVTAFLGQSVRLGSVWRRFEYPLLQINPYVKSIVDGSGSLLRYFSSTPFYNGLGNIIESIINLLANQQGEE